MLLWDKKNDGTKVSSTYDFANSLSSVSSVPEYQDSQLATNKNVDIYFIAHDMFLE